jgi:N-acetylglucosamine-6-phosphate deacetylase
MILANARLVFPERIAARGFVRVVDGKIAAVSEQELPLETGETIVDVRGRFLSPGFIDMHVHGALRRDTMEADPEAFAAICKYHARGGTTSLALTTVAAPTEKILRVLETARGYLKTPDLAGAQLLGIHLEGPYFSPEKPGAHPPTLLRSPKRQEWQQFLAYRDVLTQMTLAPELPGALELIEAFAEKGIRVSGGHTDAWDEEAAAGFAHGMRQATHTFNCMSGARRRGAYRVAGFLEFALSEPEILCELIADGRHVSPTLMRMLYLAKGPEGIALITDATGGAGLSEESEFELAEMRCVVRDGVGLTGDGQSLAGSTCTMMRCVQNMVQLVGIPLSEAGARLPERRSDPRHGRGSGGVQRGIRDLPDFHRRPGKPGVRGQG